MALWLKFDQHVLKIVFLVKSLKIVFENYIWYHFFMTFHQVYLNNFTGTNFQIGGSLDLKKRMFFGFFFFVKQMA